MTRFQMLRSSASAGKRLPDNGDNKYSYYNNNNDNIPEIQHQLMNIFGDVSFPNDESHIDEFELDNIENVASRAIQKERRRRCTIICTFICYLTAIVLLLLTLIAALNIAKQRQIPLQERGVLNTLPKIEAYIKSMSTPSQFLNKNSPQSRAFQWIIEEHVEEVVEEAEKEAIIIINDNIVESKEILRQRYVLAVLYYSLNGDNWNKNDNWLSTTLSVCDWYTSGDENICSDDGLIQILQLENNNLQGTLPMIELQHLFKDQLLVFNIQNNDVSGNIPKDFFGKMTNVEKLILSGNDLEGTVPTIFDGFSTANLRLVRLDSNPKLKGTILTAEICDANTNDLIITFDCSNSNNTKQQEQEESITCDCPSSCHCCSDNNSCLDFV